MLQSREKVRGDKKLITSINGVEVTIIASPIGKTLFQVQDDFSDGIANHGYILEG